MEATKMIIDVWNLEEFRRIRFFFGKKDFISQIGLQDAHSLQEGYDVAHAS
jgi:hypothetical protein